jgi:hypothetical protein
MTHYIPPFITSEKLVHYKFGILAATAFYGPTIERSHGRPLLVRAKKADALARALPEPERTAVERAFARFHDLQAALHDLHGTEQ